MPPNLRTARKQLSYPLYGADFDPSNPDFLLVGGGGGSTSSGVPNKITLLDASRLDSLTEIIDIDLAKNEDSVTSLAVANSDDTSLTAYAGINSSIKEQEAGKNEHFRSFQIGLPSKKRRADGAEKSEASNAASMIQTKALTRTALFKSTMGAKSDTYQRVLRVSPSHEEGGERLAAIASGLADSNEVLVLRATAAPGLSSVISRIDVGISEASDLDIVPVEDEAKSHVLAYCTDYDVYLQHIPSSSGVEVKEPIKVFTESSSGRKIKTRCLRWLSNRYLLLLRNKPGGGGSELVMFKTDKDYTQVKEILVKTLGKSTKQAVGLATCALSTSPKGDRQFLVAVAGQDSSLEIFAIDQLQGSGMTKFKQYAHLRDVHSGPITRITFSTFRPPSLPVSKETRPQYVRLASVGVDLNVVVQTLPLRPSPAVYTKEPRYVLIPPPETSKNVTGFFMAFLIVGIVAFLTQVFCELRGVLPPTLNAQSWLSPKWHARLVSPYPYNYRAIDNMPGPVIPESLPPIISSVASATVEKATEAAEAGATLLQDLIAEQKLDPSKQDHKIVIRDSDTDSSSDTASDSVEGGGLEAELHHHDSDAVQNDHTIKKWDQLSEKEKKKWKRRLVEAGRWTEKQGESVLKGILFSELGAAVGAAMRGA